MAAASSGDQDAAATEHTKVRRNKMIARSGFTPPALLPADRRLADRRLVKCSSACPPSHAAASHEAKCIASAQALVHGMLATFIWEAAQQAACMLWEEI